MKKPIVAAVEGYCYAGGMEILQAFDIRVAAEDAQLAVSEVQRGLFPMSASTIRLPRQIPYTVAMDMLLVGDPDHRPAGLRHRPRRPRHAAGRGAGQGPRAGRPAGRQRAAGGAQHQGVGDREPRAQGGRRLPARARARHGGHGVEGRQGGPRAFLEKRAPNFTGAVNPTAMRAIRPVRSTHGKKRTGGRVTPKGTQPAATSKGKAKPAANGAAGPAGRPGPHRSGVEPGRVRSGRPHPRRPPRRQPLDSAAASRQSILASSSSHCATRTSRP